MYLPAAFAESRPEALTALIQAYPFGDLIRAGADGLDADHLPFEYDPARGPLGMLTAHVARANPLWRDWVDGSPVLVVFHGPQGYISPNGYPSKHETHRQVPTWNYAVVHAHGRLSIHDDERFVRGVVARLTRRHEASQPVPWKMGDAPRDYLDEMLAQIVGIEIAVTRLVGKAKFGQDEVARDRLGAADAAAAEGNATLADAMRRTGADGIDGAGRGWGRAGSE